MKLLIENWRKYLNEGIDPRIQKQIDSLVGLGGVGVQINPNRRAVSASNYVEFRYYRIPGSGLSSDDVPFGRVHIIKASPAQEGPCLGGYVVVSANAEKGWGPLLYEVAIEWASQNGAGLTPDRDSVSSQAVAVWNKYEKRGDVDRQQMDVDHKLGGDREWLRNFDQLTPKIRVDDCDQSAALNYAGANSPGWDKVSLSKMYSKDNTEVIDTLRELGKLRIIDVRKTDDVVSAIQDAF
jgi:hypothetical protein